MYLHSLYCEPSGLFDRVNFKAGMNFIYGKKEADLPKESLNSIGKSTFLDLIDFCLLCSHLKNHNPRLFAAKKVILDYQIVLEFDINEKPFRIKRSFSNPNLVTLEEDGEPTLYKIEELKTHLANLIFKKENYVGVFSPKWFRNLMALYLKIQKPGKDKFLNPIKFVSERGETELNTYHLFFLDIDNRLAQKNYEHRVNLKKLEPAIRQVEHLVREKFDIDDPKKSLNEVNRLRLDIKRLSDSMENFRLGEQYVDTERQANELTSKIKNLFFQNHLDKIKVDSYKNSYSPDKEVSPLKIKNLYDQVSKNLGVIVKKTLDEVVKFRAELNRSRKNFLKDEIEKVELTIKEREEIIEKLESQRAELFYFLSAKEALVDLTEAYVNINEKRNKLADLEGNTKLLRELSDEKRQIESELKTLEIKVNLFLDEAREQIFTLYRLFNSIYEAIYVSDSNESHFSISFDKGKERMMDISVSMPDMLGKGKNQGRTLIYDLMVLTLNSFKYPCYPKFLIHDGIFDGMDKAHFIAVWDFIEKSIAGDRKLQYIVTLNEEGTLSERFGNSDKTTPEKIEQEAILILTPKEKLFKEDF